MRTDEQKQRDLERIAKYRDLEDQVRSHVSRGDYNAAIFQLTSKLLRLNPEYYTIWNVRRRCLISGSFSRPSAGSSCSRACSTTSRTATTAPSSTSLSPSSSAATPPAHDSPTAGRSGTTAETTAATAPSTDESTAAETQDLATLRSELAFTIPLLLESPKCYWIWSYRLWLLQQAITRLRPQLARQIWEEELRLASKMLDKDRRNFHAWGYRRHVVTQLESDALQGSSMVAAEFDYTSSMIRKDLSNFSAWHSRGKLIPRLLEERAADEQARRVFLDEGMCFAQPTNQMT